MTGGLLSRYGQNMTADPRAALATFVTALERHLEMASVRHGDDDPRVVGTIEAVREDLMVDGFVLRYRTDLENSADQLPGDEGAFLACSFWMANALLSIGRQEEARELFERLLSLRNDVGLLAEEWDPGAGRQVGNFPQAFSHLTLVGAAVAVQAAERADRV